MRSRSLVSFAVLVSTAAFAFGGDPVDPAGFQSKVKVACVGDSITFGAGVKPRNTMAFPAQLGRMLGERWEVRNFGGSGATIKDEMIPMLREVAKETKADVIDLHVALAPHQAYFPDTVHPNAKGATVIAQTVHRALTGKEALLAVPASR